MDGIVEPGFKISSQTIGMAKTDKIKFDKNRINVLHLGLKKISYASISVIHIYKKIFRDYCLTKISIAVSKAFETFPVISNPW